MNNLHVKTGDNVMIISGKDKGHTGKMKLVDTAGRVDKFMSRYAKRYDKKGAK